MSGMAIDALGRRAVSGLEDMKCVLCWPFLNNTISFVIFGCERTSGGEHVNPLYLHYLHHSALESMCRRRTVISSIGILKHKAIVQRLGRYAEVNAL